MDARVTKDPVDRDLRRRRLAQRLVRHQARTKTIFLLTGLSRHQLATLRQRWQVGTEMRLRGPAPTSFSVLLSTVRMRAEAATLAVFWISLGRVAGGKHLTMLELGESLCDVFDVYLACFPTAELELEHLILLARGIEAADAIAVGRCSSCKGAMLVDLLGLQRRLCSHCQHVVDVGATPREDGNSGAHQPSPPLAIEEAVQQELF